MPPKRRTLAQLGRQDVSGGDRPSQDGRSRPPSRPPSRASSRSSVDRVLIEHFSSSDSSSSPSLREPQPSAGNLDSADNQHPVHGWISKLGRGVNRSAAKRRARKLLDELIQANNTTDGQATARQRRYKAATGLVEIIENIPDGGEILARRFVKSASRQDQGTQALLRLSDHELDLFGSRAVSPVPEPLAFTKLLDVVRKHPNESEFFRRTISTQLRDGEEGVAAILYLVTTMTPTFSIDLAGLIIDFCNRIVTKEASFCLKWYCVTKLQCILLEERPLTGFARLIRPIRPRQPRQPRTITLSSICKGLIRATTSILDPNVSEESEKDPVGLDAPLLFMIAVCCHTMKKEDRSCLPTSDIVNTFVKRLIDLIYPAFGSLQVLNMKCAFALSTLRSLVKNQLIVTAISGDTLSKLGTMFLEVGLNRWALNIHGAERFEKYFLRRLKSNLAGCCIRSLCLLPQSTFNSALASALNKGILQLNSPETSKPYEPLALVERLLWLSNLRQDFGRPEQVLRGLVEGGACGFLTIVLSHTGDFPPQDRGLWRAKGLAMTCLGNIVERMDEDQFCNHVTKETIDAVVAMKNHEDVPLVQRGQAIFMLWRYTLAADRWGIQPHYREDNSEMDEDTSNMNVDTLNVDKDSSSSEFISGADDQWSSCVDFPPSFCPHRSPLRISAMNAASPLISIPDSPIFGSLNEQRASSVSQFLTRLL